ncbi:MAG: flavin reductase family protein [Clostridia bacterium]|nr:flavin reductase family protein [Clostridia bacterium]
MFYEPSKNNHGLERNPFKSCTVPRCIGWISTKNEDGSDNIAPYSQFTNLTFDPPLVIFSANQNVYKDRKTTVKNAERTGEFIYNMVPYDLRDQMNLTSSIEVPEGMDKFEYAGLTKVPGNLVNVMRVGESPIQYECKYLQTIRLQANSSIATVDVIVGEVIGIHIDDDVITDGKVDIPKIKPLARLGYFDYTVIEKSFEIPAPRVSPEKQAFVDVGLEGKAEQKVD